ncbi:MAG TPA: hypothetical protein VHX62_07425 [Solirubrobacteraceae bacterium]|jgi:hypothetical protein|nr:hypothetical protein [Solirubrobacteraceae bacterium]
MSVETTLTVLAIMIYVVARQIAGEPLRVKRLLGLPVALTVIGIVDVAHNGGRGPTRDDIVLIAAGVAINAVIGIGQGRLMRLESRHGYALGAHLATASAVMLLRLGVNQLAQAAIVAPRAPATGIPFAPEPDGTAAPLRR